MADKRIDQLTAATTMGDDDLLVLQQNNQAKKLPGSVLSDYVYDVVEVSNTQPIESRNKVWIKPSSEDLVLAEQSDVDELKTAFTEKIDSLSKGLAPKTYSPTLYITSDDKYYYFSESAQRFYQSDSKKYLSTRYLNNVYDTTCAFECRVDGIQMRIAYFNENGAATTGSATGYLGHTANGTGIIYCPPEAVKFLLTFSKIDGSAITSEEATAIGNNIYRYYYIDSSLTMDGKAADAKVVGDKFNGIFANLVEPEDVVGWEQGAFDRTNGNVLSTANAIRTDSFVPDNVIKITCSDDYKMNLWAWNKTTGSYIGHLQENGTYGTGTTYLFQREIVLDRTLNYKYKITFYNTVNSNPIIPSAGSNAIINVVRGTNPKNIITANSPSFSGESLAIFENDDSSAITNVDDGLFNCVSVIKISDSMYYMYYESYGANGGTTYADANWCFAYSTDGETFVKGFPQGITSPIADTNMLLAQGSVHGACVVKVPDADYPFRMIGVIGTDADRITKLWKSADGINWSVVRQITAGYNDSFTSCVVRGNTLKIFLRTREGNVRAIGIIITDLDGNRLCSSWNQKISSSSSQQQLYQASASALDDKREILFPTIYNPSTSAETVGCLILDGESCLSKTIDTSSIIDTNIKSIYFGCGLVNIGLKMYAYYTTRNADHEHFVLGTTKSAIRRIEVADTTIPSVVRPA